MRLARVRRLGVRGGVAERLHHQIRRQTQARQVHEFVARHLATAAREPSAAAAAEAANARAKLLARVAEAAVIGGASIDRAGIDTTVIDPVF